MAPQREILIDLPRAAKPGFDRIMELIRADNRFAGFDPKFVANEIAVFTCEGSLARTGTAEHTREFVDNLYKYLEGDAALVKNAPKGRDVLRNGAKPMVAKPSFVAGITENWKGLTGGEKTMTGLGLVSAALSTVAAFSHASKAIEKDAEGNRHLKPSMVGMALLDTAFAVGLTYLSVLTLRSGSAR